MLNKLISNPQISIYELSDIPCKGIKKYIFSTQETRQIINDPLLVGIDYTNKLRIGIEYFLSRYIKISKETLEEKHVNVMHFLRGGLNFYLRDAIANSFNFNTHNVSFLSSQRSVDEHGRWFIKEDSYEKITIQKGSTVFLGDVVATGVTLDHGLNSLTRIIKNQKGSIKKLIFFTIGCHKAEKILKKYYNLWRTIFSDFEGIDLVYIEGKFHLADTKTPVQIKFLGTDLLKRDAILSPELIDTQNDCISYPLERCVIYDAGSRAFDIPEYIEDVIEYWQEVKSLAEKGVTTKKYMGERYPNYTRDCDTPLEHICDTQITKLKNI